MSQDQPRPAVVTLKLAVLNPEWTQEHLEALMKGVVAGLLVWGQTLEMVGVEVEGPTPAKTNS